jgi:RNA polymerase sigma-70 factor (ECF subfamily)
MRLPPRRCCTCRNCPRPLCPPGWHAVKGELHFRLGQHAAAERAWREALRWTSAGPDQEFLRRRLADCRRLLGVAAEPNS